MNFASGHCSVRSVRSPMLIIGCEFIYGSISQNIFIILLTEILAVYPNATLCGGGFMPSITNSFVHNDCLSNGRLFCIWIKKKEEKLISNLGGKMY